MGLNFLKISWRLMRHHKSYSLINIIGLAVGLASCILVLLWVQDELRFDHFHQKLDELYRVVNESHKTTLVQQQAVTPAPLAAVLKAEFTQIQRATRYTYGEALFRVGDVKLDEPRIGYADSDFLEMFSFPLLSGNPATALQDPNSVVLSRELAEKLFGSANVLGKTVQIKQKYDLTVTGLFDRVPENSSLQFNCLVPFELLGRNEDLTFWGAHRYYTFVQLAPDSESPAVSAQISGVLAVHEPESKSRLWLQPFKEMHLNPKLNYDIFGTGDLKYVWLFSALAIFMLVIACINFVNLTTARSSNRAKEIGIRRTVGANRQQLFQQFIGESLVFALISLVAAMILVELVLPAFNQLSGKTLSLNFLEISHNLGLFGLLLITGMLAGGYPALMLSGFQPARMVKSRRGQRFSRTIAAPPDHSHRVQNRS